MACPSTEHGFTLVETLVVITIISLLVAVMLPNMVPTPGKQLRTNASELVNALRETRLHAQRHQRNAALVLDTRGNTYRQPGSAQAKSLPGKFKLRLTTAEREVIDGASGRIRFFADGSSTGGRITLSHDSSLQHIDVAWLTGRIQLIEESR